MGADMLLATVVIPVDRQPDWAAAELHVANMTQPQLDEFAEYAGLDGDAQEVRDHLSKLLQEFHELVEPEGHRSREMGFFDLLGHTLYFSGGMSWGDSPTEAFDVIVNAEAAGIAEAAGFSTDTNSVRLVLPTA